MSPETPEFYKFANFHLDRSQKVLLRDGSPVPLTPKVYDTLEILLENRARLLEKDELMQRLWPDRFVEESNLTSNIKMLRRALNDDAHQPRFIETVPRRGYRFIAKVRDPFDPLDSASKSPVPILRDSKRYYLAAALLVIVLAGSIVTALMFAPRGLSDSVSSAPILSAPFRSDKVASGGIVRAVITPDGKYVAYTTETGNKESVWLRQLETSENIQIVPPINEQYLGLTVSNDGNSLYFVRKTLTDQPTSALYRVTTFGGIPVKITDRTEGTVSLSPDDKQIAFTRCNYKAEDFCSLMLIDADGKNERKLLTRQEPIRLSGNQFSPDGRSIAYASGQSWNGGSDFHLMLLDLAGGTERQISSKTFFDIWNLKWLPDGDSLLVAAKEVLDGRLRIWLVSAAIGEVSPVTNDTTDYISLSLDKHADKMIATHLTNTFHLYLADTNDVSNLKDLAVARTGVAFAPDGRMIYGGNDGDIWSINRDGGEQRQLTNSPFTDFYPCVSPDGHYVFFTSNRSGTTQVWRMNLDGTDQVQITKREGGYPVFVTPDGKWVYFGSGLRQTLWRVSTEGGDETEVSNKKIVDSAFSPDGRFIAYFFRNESDNRLKIALMSVDDLTISKIFALPDETFRGGRIAWMNDNKSFYYVTTNKSQSSLWQQPIETNAPHLIANLGSDELANLALSPDGHSLAFIRGRWIHDAVLIEGLK